MLPEYGAASLLDVEEDHDVLPGHVEEDGAGAAVVGRDHLAIGHQAVQSSAVGRRRKADVV